ncbi:hypothetical protein DYQ86_13535 [Acidobacteria bacterium AB60]|nr:hypothetical protein DYQ86_13535 [Acidobacteria bacterium AB60]
MARRFVGLTDDPARREQDHNNPKDWKQRTFATEDEARRWMKELLEDPEFETGAGDRGWRYGYTYTIRPWTRE